MKLIVAVNKHNHKILNGKTQFGIGKKAYKEDRDFLREKVKDSSVVMGYNTYMDIPIEFFILRRNKTYVLTNKNDDEIFYKVHNNRLMFVNDIKYIPNDVFVLGAYSSLLPFVSEMFITYIDDKDAVDTGYTPYIPFNDFKVIDIQTLSDNLEVYHYKKIDNYHEEYQYLNLCNTILTLGKKRNNRTGVDTISVFSPPSFSFSLRDNRIPLLTTKKVFWYCIVEELLWMLRGSTSAKELSDKKVNIWNENATREFLDKQNLFHYEEGDLGPVYGFQWRHFGAQYDSFTNDYTGFGIDQISMLIENIKNDPTSRRHIVSAWNPLDISKMALAPCHILFQVYVNDDDTLDLHLYQRSGDVPLGIPFNIASYSLLCIILAHCTGKKAGTFYHTIGDAHIYTNQIKGIQQQIVREPFEFPTLQVITDNKDISKFMSRDFELQHYKSHTGIKFEFAV